MRLRRAVVCLFLVSAPPTILQAQSFNLRDLLNGSIELAEPPGGFPSHVEHFVGNDPDQSLALQQVNAQIANQLSSFPLASSAGGFTYTFDPALGVFERASESFGPVYAERVDTVGKGRFNLGLNYSHFTFDAFNGASLRDGGLKLVFTHSDSNHDGSNFNLFFEGDVITAQLSLKITSDITAFVLTYGVTDRLDIGTAIPIVRISIDLLQDAEIQRLATGTIAPGIHQFPNGGSTQRTHLSGSASGVGDVVLRAKYRVTCSTKLGLALGTDVRLPTGEDADLLGTGATQLKAFLIGSAHFGSFSPHVNAGYNWFLHPSSGQHIPDEVSYVAGFDLAVGPRLTLIADVIGRTFLRTQIVRVVDTVFEANTSPNPQAPEIVSAVFPRVTATTGNLNTLHGSVGFKINPVGNLLLTVNALFSINKGGLVDKFTPLVGLDYGF